MAKWYLSASDAIICGLIMALGGFMAGYGMGHDFAREMTLAGSPPGYMSGFVMLEVFLIIIGIGILVLLEKGRKAK